MKNKSRFIFIIIFALLIVLINSIFFIVPKDLNNNGAAYWIVYSFTNLMLVLGLGSFICLSSQNKTNKKVYFIPVVKNVIIFSSLQIVVFVITLSLLNFVKAPFWPFLLVEIILLISCLIVGLFYILNKNHIQIVDAKKENEKFISNLRIQVSSLVRRFEDSELKTDLNRLNESIKYTNPVSNEKSHEVEDEILEHMIKLENQLNDGDYLNAKKTISIIKNLILDRKELLTD